MVGRTRGSQLVLVVVVVVGLPARKTNEEEERGLGRECKRGEFPARPRGRRRPRSAGEEDNRRRRTTTSTRRVRRGRFLLVLVVVVVLGLPARKVIDDEGRRRVRDGK